MKLPVAVKGAFVGYGAVGKGLRALRRRNLAKVKD